MALCSYVERRRQTYYFRLRLPAGIDDLFGRTHLVASLGTRDPGAAKLRAAKLFLVVDAFVRTLSLRMKERDYIDEQETNATARAAEAAFKLGCRFGAQTEALRHRHNAELRDLVQRLQQDWRAEDLPGMHQADLRSIAALAPGGADALRAADIETADFDNLVGLTGVPDHPAGLSSVARHGSATAITAARPGPGSLPWHSHLDAFFADKPDLSPKTRLSYGQAFTAWRGLISDKPIDAIRRTDLKLYADHLRDRPNPRGGQLNHKTIVRSLSHLKVFMAWAVSAGLANDDRFQAVQARSTTSTEKLAGPARRAFTEAELTKLFHSRLFIHPEDRADRAAAWFLAMAAMTGARTEELANAPAQFVRIGDIDCLDLRLSGRKTAAAPRLVPLLPGLIGMGLPAWAAEQEALGFGLLQPGPEPVSAAAWSKRLNRYISGTISDDPTLVLYSLRHSFRQMLRAAVIGEELADKVFGHSSDRVGAGYGRALSVQEAILFIERVRPPISLSHLWSNGL